MTRAKKSFGQHFLKDKSVAKRMVATVDLGDDSTIVEIGPGTGALTKEIASALPKGADLKLIEADRDLVQNLEAKFPGAEIHQADAAQFNFASITDASKWILLSNLPYNAANAILMNALQSEQPPAQAVVMVQKEVADRMLAKPGQMSLLSVAVQLYASVKRLFNVSPSAFSPKPKVDSSVILLEPFLNRDKEEIERIIAVAKAGFSSRRKQLHKNISAANIASGERVQEVLVSLDFSKTARAQELSIEAWKELTGKL